MKFREMLVLPRTTGELALTAEEIDTLKVGIIEALGNLPKQCNKGNILLHSQEFAQNGRGPCGFWDFDRPVMDATLEDGDFRLALPNSSDYKSEVLTKKAIDAVVEWRANVKSMFSADLQDDWPHACILMSNAHNVMILNSDKGRFIASSQIVRATRKDGYWDDCEWSWRTQDEVLLAIARILAKMRPDDKRLTREAENLMRTARANGWL